MTSGDYGVRFLVAGKEVEVIQKDEHVFLEALAGKPYSIEIRGPNGMDTMTVIAVDGVNPITNTRTGDEGPGYVHHGKPWEIKGFEVDQEKAQEFKFGALEESIGSEPAERGFIRLVFFSGRIPAPTSSLADPTDIGTMRGQEVPFLTTTCDFVRESIVWTVVVRTASRAWLAERKLIKARRRRAS